MFTKKSFQIGLLASCLLLGCGNDDGVQNPQDDDAATPPVTDNPPVDDPPVDDPPVDDPPVDDPPVENPPAENPPAENPPAEEPDKITCTHDVCSIDYQDVLDGKAEKLGIEYRPCVDGFLGEVQSCPDNQVCIDGGCMNNFVVNDKEACKIDPSYEFTLAYENDHGQCTANGNYAIVCRYGKMTVRTCKQPCENVFGGYARCPQKEEGTKKEFFDRFYCDAYDALTNEEKAVYQKIYETMLEAIEKGESTVVFEDINKELLNNANHAARVCLNDLPVIESLSHGSSQVDSPNYTTYSQSYRAKNKDPKKDQEEQAIQNAGFEILEQTDTMETDAEKELYIHNWMADNIIYVRKDECHSVYSTLVKREGVCDGFSNSFKYLMDRLAIPTWVVSDTPGEHAWNIVQLGDDYYNVDVTWDAKGSIYHTNDGNELLAVDYTFFNRNDEFTEKRPSHKRDAQYSPENGYPSCNSTNHAFEVLIGDSRIFEIVKQFFPIKVGKLVTSVEEFYEEAYRQIDSFEIGEAQSATFIMAIIIHSKEVYDSINSISYLERKKRIEDYILNTKFPGYTLTQSGGGGQVSYGDNIYLYTDNFTLTRNQ